MSTTQAESAVMEQVAAKFDDVQQSIQTTLSALMREVESVRAGRDRVEDRVRDGDRGGA